MALEGASKPASAAAPEADVPMQGTQALGHPLSQGAAGCAVGESARDPIGEFSPVSLNAQTVINGQSSRELIIAVGERLVVLNNAERAASAQRGAHVNIHGMEQCDGPTEVPRPSWNEQWLNVVLTFAKDSKYDGLSLVPQTHD
jgi:hypothetical protein